MSCESCEGCFTASSCSTPKLSKKEAQNESAKFQSLLDLAAAKNWKEESTKDHDHVIPTIMAEMSKNVYSSQLVLFQAYDNLSQKDFIQFIAYLYQIKIVGMHIAWAAEFCENDSEKLFNILKQPNNSQQKSLLIQYCNDKAEIHEMFSQLSPGSIGRISLLED